MPTWIEALKAWELVLGLVLTIGGGFIGLLTWYDRRTRSFAVKAADEQSQERRAGMDRIAGQLRALEVRLTDVEGDLDGVQRTISNLASAADVVELKVKVSALDATMVATSGKVDMIYRAMVRAAGAEE